MMRFQKAVLLTCLFMLLAAAQGASKPPAATEPAAAIAPRVVLLEEVPPAPGVRESTGSVTWRTETIQSDVAVRAEIDLPDRRLKMTLLLRRNLGRALPASHTIDLTFTLPPDFEGGGIRIVPGILMKTDVQSGGMPLAAVGVKVSEGVFLVGFSDVPADRQRNLKLLRERSLMDISLVFANARRGFMMIELGDSGRHAIDAALNAWTKKDPARL